MNDLSNNNYIVNAILQFESTVKKQAGRLQAMELLLKENQEYLLAAREYHEVMEGRLTLLAQEIVRLHEQVAELVMAVSGQKFNFAGADQAVSAADKDKSHAAEASEPEAVSSEGEAVPVSAETEGAPAAAEEAAAPDAAESVPIKLTKPEAGAGAEEQRLQRAARRGGGVHAPDMRGAAGVSGGRGRVPGAGGRFQRRVLLQEDTDGDGSRGGAVRGRAGQDQSVHASAGQLAVRNPRRDAWRHDGLHGDAGGGWDRELHEHRDGRGPRMRLAGGDVAGARELRVLAAFWRKTSSGFDRLLWIRTL